MGIRELRAEASKLGIKNYSRMNKAELEAALTAASGATTSVSSSETSSALLNAESIGEVAGCAIVVSKSDPDETISKLLGSFNKGDARQVRKLMRAAGFIHFAALPRIVADDKAKAA